MCFLWGIAPGGGLSQVVLCVYILTQMNETAEFSS